MSSASLTVLYEALQLIARDGCENYVSFTCRSPGSGRTRGAYFGAEAWCQACIALDAIERAGVEA